ncbi:MAG: VOC family protein [Chloroflexota bacterium]
MNWSKDLPVRMVRIVRPTNKFDEVVKFYRDIIGLPELGGFSGHAGYTGVMVGLPDERYHIEIVTHEEEVEEVKPTREDTLVLYIDDTDKVDKLVKKLIAHGYHPVEPENPYWAIGGISFEDPDGWGFILMNMKERQRLLDNG